jgi:hypothetical protein
VAFSGSAFAGTSIVCTNISGTESGGSTISGCTGGNTGGASMPGLALASGATIHWVSGSTTTFGTVAYSIKPGKHCPGYSKTASVNPSLIKFSAPVTADTGDGIALKSAKGQVCASPSGVLSSFKPLKIT